MTSMSPTETDCLVLVDLQYDFMPGGALAVSEGDLLVPLANRLAERFAHVVATQDWHPADHTSFVSQHPGREPFTTVAMPYGTQTLWPDHCVQGTPGAELHKDLALDRAELIIRKGYRRAIDSYSAFLENDQTTPTGLGGYLRERGIQRLFFAGLATDFCVAWSVLDARMAGFEAVILTDACRAIDLAGSLDAAMAGMVEVGAVIGESSAVLG
ncbi:bifunctional nicotinamidase/pyrazinamidase [Thalassobaculum sp. OXR-137]|uniref:bifunctional nicotinamidase/pyrazinamidase n=1 Tax=Thalassobaculum sp. OXR-137 TaxID=3100173 RepID=UPI002AC9101D|nr:bifunctional nicotinamidase/pyrazinamidase [Thalassobaculum sp. OXR-137]WPZ34333.1 bifunctional nicotinamidase/pyrazinamidase [Thalassobaculum sp. OXR-137]